MIRLGLLLVLLVPLANGLALSRGYEGPYLGAGTPRFYEPKREIAAAALAADFVFIGTTRSLDTSHYEGIGRGYYTGEIVPEKMLKSSAAEPLLELAWQPSATGIEAGSRHVFFVKREDGKLKVVKEIFIHEGTYPCCRAYGAMDGGTEVTLDAIAYLAAPEAGMPTGHKERLLAEMQERSVHRQGTAVYLANETRSAECLPGLEYAVANRTEFYPTAIYVSCLIDGAQGAKTALGLLDVPVERNRNETLAIYDAIARAGNAASVGPLKELGDARPEQRVSCAFAIAMIAPERVGPIVKGWIADGKHKGRSEVVSADWWDNSTYPVDVLLKAAAEGKNPLSEEFAKEAKR